MARESRRCTVAATSTGKHDYSMAYCKKQAKEKKLSGDESQKFVHACREGRKTD